MAQRRLEQDLDRIGEAFHFAEGIETVDGALAEGGGDLLGGTKGVEGHTSKCIGGPLWLGSAIAEGLRGFGLVSGPADGGFPRACAAGAGEWLGPSLFPMPASFG